MPSLHMCASMIHHRTNAAQRSFNSFYESLLICCRWWQPFKLVSTINFCASSHAHSGRRDCDIGCILQVAFTVSAAAIAALQATRAAAAGQPPARDILVLHPRGRLSLYVGARHVCDVSVRATAPPNMDGPLNRLLPPAPAGVFAPVHSAALSLGHVGLQYPVLLRLSLCEF